MAADLHAALRTGTQREHRELEQRVEQAGLLASRTGYARFLAGWVLLRSSAESALEQAGVAGIVPDWQRRRRAALALQDLRALSGIEPAPLTANPFRLAGTADVLGTLYVIEGAMLGGRIIAARLAALGIDARSLRFVSGSGADEPGWPAFLRVLEDWEKRVDAERSVLAARRAFGVADALLLRPA